MLNEIHRDLKRLANPTKAKVLARFFKTGPGEYGEGDVFLGIQVPDIRKVARKHKDLALADLKHLLSSKIHEERLAALLVLREKYDIGSPQEKKEIADFYFANTKAVSNWDLVDLSAQYIIGNYLFDKDKVTLYELAKSNNLWERRIAIVATFEYIKRNKFEETFKIAEMLLNDKHDLIHKAVGWMLREVGKRDQTAEEQFLKKHYAQMPRTMLRYATERLNEQQRSFYIKKISLSI